MDEATGQAGEGARPASPPGEGALPVAAPSEGKPRRRTWVWVVAGVAALLLLCGCVGTVAYFSLRGPAQQAAAYADAMRGRVAKDYPDYTITGFKANTFTSVSGSGSSTSINVTLASKVHDGFVISVTYTAQGPGAAAVSAFKDEDMFFRASSADRDLVDSFALMWLADHPDEMCTAVRETTGGESGVRSFDVGYFTQTGVGGFSYSRGDFYVYRYDVGSRRWTRER